ncbi:MULTISPECIES: DUF4174 domain-containing protein [Roseicyclus]|jgi:hypothetical protein|uniref:DUF4174 domain-containing protein n=1 Tax=Roseicyclus amphidinii TaxID=3034232 RepID=UPI0024E15B2F|nr:DUF4174 domain-containing protein [Roseicyclus sp. Amp-Y-6]
MRPTHLALIAVLAMTGAAPAQDTDPTAADSVAMAAAADSAQTEPVEAIGPLAPRDAADVALEDFIWVARPVIVFADSPNDPRFIEQMQLLAARPDPLLERDVVIITDTDPSARSGPRIALRPRGFSLVVLQKDGSVGFRRPSPRDVREIVRGIDNFQFRQEELRSGGQ